MISDSLAGFFRSLGGEIVTGWRVESAEELPQARLTFCDLSPRGLLKVFGNRLTARYRRALERYRYGPGAFKLDWALDGPIPWQAEECLQAATVHVGGTLEEIASSEREPWHGRSSEKPFVLLAQPSLFDPSRAPEGKHTAWAYCHVPNGSDEDMTSRIENQIERFAPGFKKIILGRSVRPPSLMKQHNANLVGGDVGGGAMLLSQLFLRPTWRNYSTPIEGLYLCSASTPPGGGVHGLCGYFAAQAALKEVRQ